jgi:branched-chain amino acid transport system substrate-binding protein
MMKSPYRIFLSLFLGLALVLTGCIKREAKTIPCPEIPVGVIIGSGGVTGSQEQREGYEMALAEINRAGGVQNGCMLRLIYSESDSADANPDKAQIGILDLADQGALVILGATSNVASKRVAAISGYIQTPVLVTNDTADDVVTSTNRWTFRINPSHRTQAEAAFQYIKSTLGQQSAVAILYEQTEYGQSAAVSAGKTALGLDLTIVSYQSFSTAVTDLSEVLKAAADANPAVLYLISSDPVQTSGILAAIQENNLALPTIIGSGAAFQANQLLFQNGSLNPDLENLMFSTSWAETLPWLEASGFPVRLQAYRETAENPLTGPVSIQAVQAYTALQLAARAIDATPARTAEAWKALLGNPEKVAAYRLEMAESLRSLQAETNPTPLGRLEFTPSGQASTAAIMVQVKNGALKVIYPLEFTGQANVKGTD